MNYKARLYLNTGFNAVNIPDRPSLLDQFAYVDCTAIDIMQNRFLTRVRVSATWDNIKDADYLRIYTDNNAGDFYSIKGINMLAKDVAELSIVYDYVTSGGGVSNLQILDGVTSRVHVTDDSFGRYTENDPLMAPAQPLEVQTTWFNPNTDTHTYIEATVNLPVTGASKSGNTFTDENGDTVTVPSVVGLTTRFTTYILEGLPVTSGVDPYTMLYDLNDTTDTSPTGGLNNRDAIRQGVNRCRELGIETGAIVNQVKIPTAYAETRDFVAETVTVDGQDVVNRSIITFKGKTGTVSSNIPYSYTGARNNRLNYGEYTKYGIISCSGESCEYLAEDIIDSNNPTAPVVKYLGDPYTTGKPYFRYRVVNGDSSDIGFFRNCITGLTWKQVPLFFANPSGTALNTLKYQNSRNIADTSFENANRVRGFNAARDAVSGVAGGVADIMTGRIGSGVASLMGTGFNAVGAAMDYDNALASYQAQKQSEMSDYLVSNTVAAPEISFPYNSELMRDFYGNGVMMYRYKYSTNDINRIDKLLTMYGYRFTKPLEKTDFTSKVNFNYVECANVSVTGHPNWFNDGIAMMLKNGVRVWHVKPNPALYDQTNANS